MTAERECLGPANWSILASTSAGNLIEIFIFVCIFVSGKHSAKTALIAL